MAKFDLAEAAWTQIIAPGGSTDQMISVSFGEALIVYGAPDVFKAPFRVGGSGPRQVVVPSGIAVSARPAGPRVALVTGDAGGAFVAPLRVVGTNSRVGGQTYTLSGSQTSFNYRTPHKMGGLVTELTLLFSNWASAAGSAGELLNPNAITHSKVAVEVDGAATSVPVTFSGARSSGPIAGNQLLKSDPVPAAALGFPNGIPRDTLIWVRGKGLMAATGATVYCGTFASFTAPSGSVSRSYSYDPANENDTVDGVGNLGATTGQTQRQYAPGPVILGRFATLGVPSVLVAGDSIAESSSDTINPAPVVDGAGYFSRATEKSGGGDTIAMLHLTKPSDVASGWIAQRAMRSQYFQYCNAAIEELGVNDIGTALNANGQPATLYANLQTIWADMRSKGIEKVYRTNYLPRTNGAWTAADGSDQTQITWYDDTRDAMDTNFSAGLSSGLLNGIVDVRTPAALSGNSKKWLASGTSDGLHPAPSIHIAQAVPMRAALVGISVTS